MPFEIGDLYLALDDVGVRILDTSRKEKYAVQELNASSIFRDHKFFDVFRDSVDCFTDLDSTFIANFFSGLLEFLLNIIPEQMHKGTFTLLEDVSVLETSCDVVDNFVDFVNTLLENATLQACLKEPKETFLRTIDDRPAQNIQSLHLSIYFL